MQRLANERIDAFAKAGRCEFYSEYAHPFAALVIADLLGVPTEDRELFWAKRRNMTPPSAIDPDAKPTDFHDFVAGYFDRYLEQRKSAPSKDIFSEFAAAKKPDGTAHSKQDVLNLAVMIFGAGQGTTAHFLATSLRILSENSALQRQLRENLAQVPDFIEEALRYDGPIKNTFRLARKSAVVGGVDIPVGTCIMVATSASNRDPRRYDDPETLKLGRPQIREHLAFGRGPHTCPGAALARTEIRISLERLLSRLREIRVSEAKHGPPDARRYEFEPTYLLRGLRNLHLEFKPA
jgi:cytochrome P450